MKIQKQFIPLILSGDKEYEYRNNKRDLEGYYVINNEIYKLFFCGSINYDEFVSQRDTSNVDAKSLDWILNNKKYFACVSVVNNYEIIIYRWTKIVSKQLEII